MKNQRKTYFQVHVWFELKTFQFYKLLLIIVIRSGQKKSNFWCWTQTR